MFYALSFFVVFSLLVLWSLAAWVFHSLAVWTVSNAGALAAGSGAIEALSVPAWLAPWVPGELTVALNAMIPALMPTLEGLLAWIPALSGGITIAVWTVWGIGVVILIVLGILVAGLISLLRRRGFVPAKTPIPQ